ncbi:MAG: HAD family hydrolase [Candidatus Omnitrophica bacterium]|nr:HAD family hydrolase [Candidatus Omnitrophota bacterium]
MTAAANGRPVFVDRDGVINLDYVGDYVKRWEDFKFLPGSLAALARLTAAGFQTVIVSNQAGIGDGVYPKAALDDITQRMITEIAKAGGRIDAVYYCLHGKEEGCGCRKPKTGLFEQACLDWPCDRARTFYIGDKLSDIEAGRAFGLKTVLVLTGYGAEHRNRIQPESRPDFICDDFARAADLVIAQRAGA